MSASSSSAAPQLSLQADTLQPTVRVMRLYKPGFHIAHTFPPLPHDFSDSQSNLAFAHGGSECTLSSHLLLPDSFGDIYLGEKFTAYIAVVNGYIHAPFYNVNLSVRLQTATTVVDLVDIRSANTNSVYNGISIPILGFNESSELIVQHTLNELGTHTLRVSVQYSLSSPSSIRPTSPTPSSASSTTPVVPEVKTLRKFYRFNVLQPLIVLSSFREMLHKPMVQCQVTNSTKSPIYIEEMSYVSNYKNSEFVQLHDQIRKKANSAYQTLDIDDILILQPEESYAFAFEFRKFDGFVGRVAGFPIIKWCNAMGESSIFRGDNTLIKSNVTPTALLPQPVKFLLVDAPSSAKVGNYLKIRVKVCNTTSYQWPLKIDCTNHIDLEDSRSMQNLNPEYNPDTASHHYDHSLDQGLVFVGITNFEVGIIEASSHRDVDLWLLALSPGLYDLPVFYALHSTTKERHGSGSLCQIFLSEDDSQ